MEQLSFVVSSIVFVHFLLPYHVLLVKMRILNSFDFLDIHSTSGCLKSAQDISVLRGAWVESHSVYCHVRVWHWSPRARKRYCCETKQSQFLLVLLCCWKSKLVIANLECFRLEVYSRLPVIRTLYNSNLPLTRSNFHFPSGRFLYNFTLDNSNSR